MSIPLTKATLIAAYELLRTTPPFLGWKLPEPDDVEFTVIRTRDLYGDCDGDKIRVSAGRHGTLNALLQTMAHEVIHLHQFRRGLNTPNTEHNADFHKRAKRVCAMNCWDLKGF